MTYSSEVLADSPLLYWRLGESSGTTATDASGNGRHGTYTGSPTLGVPGLLNGDTDTAVQFDGVDDGVNVVANDSLSAVTVEAWIKALNLPTSTHRIAGRWTGSSGSQIVTLLATASTVEARVRNSAGTQAIVTGPAVDDGLVHHVALTYDGTTLRLYLDGVSVGTPSTLASGALLSANIPFAAGYRHSGLTEYFPGTIDEVAYYNTALSATRIAAHYTAGTSGPTSVTITPSHVASTAQVFNPTLVGGLQVVIPDHIASTAQVFNPTLVGGLQVVIPDHIASTAQVFNPTIVVGGAGTTISPDFINSTAVVFSPTLPETGTPEVNRAGAWVRDNIGEAVWTPAVVAPVGPQPRMDVVAQAYTAPTINGTHAQVQPDYFRESAHRDRVVIAGRDVTYFRGKPTPAPDYQLIQPLLWGAATIEMPQVVLPFEQPGHGDLSWLVPGASVLIQRVDPDTEAVVATDFRGIVIAFDTSGPLRIEVGGAAAGRAALQDRQMRLIQQRVDAGALTARAIKQIGRVRHEPPIRQVTGIELIDWGGGSLLDYINELVAKMTTVDGDQWTLMPDSNGVFHTSLKDLTTIHGTVYPDGSSVTADLRRDISEEPNRVFASGVTPNGMVVKFGAYPGLIQGTPAPYPMDDNSAFGVGTTNVDTDTGDGITVMTWRLFTAGYLDDDTGGGTYTTVVAKAVKDLQRDARLAVTGTMNPNTWKALYDLSVTGYDLRNIRILPAAQTTEVQGWRLSANGSIIARNPNYDPTVPKVDRTIAMGAGFTRAQIRQWSQTELAETAVWRGTIVITTGAIVAGNHTPGTPITSILHSRDIKPGMNFRLPLFAGGITVHVAGVSVTDNGRNVTLAVDTRPGDTLPVWAAIQRNRENRNTVHRSFFAQRRASSFDRENTFDEVGGRVSPIKLDPGWNVFPVVAKQAGVIEKLAMTLSPEREFVVGVFGRRISRKALAAVTNSPLSKAGSARWTSDAVNTKLRRKYVMLFVAGNDADPCGYSPGKKSEGRPLTGHFDDDASFPFVTFTNDTDRGSVLWVAVWVASATTLQGGRIMWPTSEDY